LRRYKLVAYNLGREIDTKLLSREKLKRRLRPSWEEPLVLTVAGCQALVYPFGAVVLVNPTPKAVGEACKLVASYVKEPSRPLSEEYEIIVLESSDELREVFADYDEEELAEVEDREIIVTDAACILNGRPLTQDVIKVVGFALAQSVALDRIERYVDRALERAQSILDTFEKGLLLARIKPAVRELIQVMRERFNALSDVMILEKPELVWEDPELDELYEELRRVFEIDDRFRAIDKALEDIMEMGEVVSDLVTASREVLLELLILCLIAVELFIAILQLLPK